MAMAGRFAPVPAEESADGSTAAAYPPRPLYRDSIRGIAVSGRQIRFTLFSRSQSGHSGSSDSSDSGTSNSCPSNNSGCSSRSAAAADFGADELKTVARQMVSDRYIQRMANLYHVAFLAVRSGDVWVRVLESWFAQLDVAWVLQIRPEDSSQVKLWLQDNSASSLQDLVESWIRGLTVIVHTMKDPVFTPHEISAVTRFGQVSISKMVIFVDAIVPVLKAENLRAVLDMYTCVCRESYYMQYSEVYPGLGLELVNQIMLPFSLHMSVNKLKDAISSTVENVRTLIEDDDSWAIEIPRGRGGVHSNTRLIADCILSLGEAEVNSIIPPNNSSSSSSNNNNSLSDVRDETIRYMKDLLLRKSELCSDSSLRYLFLLNNSYFLAQMIEPCQPGHDWKLTLECEKYMCTYLDVSWGHVLSCIPKSHFPGPLHRWINTSSLVKFESAFNRTYQTQKFWKVPDPQLRDVLRRTITERVVSTYRDYLKEHPELAEHISRRNSSPEVLEEMLGQLFEG